jgi:hypothetical protein
MATLMRLGPFTFETDSFNMQKFDRNKAFRWEPQMRIGRRPALQFLGTGEESVEIQGTIYPHYFGGLSQYQNMRDAAESGVPYPLATGTGRMLGIFCIRAVKDGNSYLVRSGAPRKVEFTISLAAYGEDDAASAIAIGVGNFPVSAAISAAANVIGLGSGASQAGNVSIPSLGFSQSISAANPTSLFVPEMASGSVANAMSNIASTASGAVSNIASLLNDIDIDGVLSTAAAIVGVASTAVAVVEQGRRLANALESGNIAGIVGTASQLATLSTIGAEVGGALIQITDEFEIIEAAATAMTVTNAAAQAAVIIDHGRKVSNRARYVQKNSAKISAATSSSFVNTTTGVVGSVDSAMRFVDSLPVVTV